MDWVPPSYGMGSIEYASRALTNAEQNWAQIEKKTLAVVFGVERFDQYTYGRKVVIENDHNPLAAILKEPLSQAPKRLIDVRDTLSHQDGVILKGERIVILKSLRDIAKRRLHSAHLGYDALAILYFDPQCHMRYAKWPKSEKPASYTNHGIRKRH